MKNKPLEFYERKLESLKTIIKNHIFNFTAINQKATYALYKIILRTGKPHTIDESLVLPAIKDVVGVMFDEKRLKEVEKLSLSNNTSVRFNLSKWFLLQLDESTDIQGLSQLIVFIRYIWMKEFHEDFLCC